MPIQIPTGWLESVRAAVTAYMLHDVARTGTIAAAASFTDAGNDDIYPVIKTRLEDRRIFVTGASEATNIGTYTIDADAAWVNANTPMVTPAFPTPSGTFTYQLESLPAYYIRTRKGNWFLHEENARLPARLAGSDFPAIEIVQLGAVTVDQVTNMDIDHAITLRFLLACKGRIFNELNYLYGIVFDRLIRGRNERFHHDDATAGACLTSVAISALQFNSREITEAGPDGSPIATGYYNSCEFDLTVRVRRQRDPLA